jgi:hypothetical protein
MTIHSTDGEMDPPLGFRSNNHILHTDLLRLDSPSVITPRAAIDSLWNRQRQVLRPKLNNSTSIALGSFEAQTTKPTVSTTPRARPTRPDACLASSRPRRQHGPLHHVLVQVCVLGVRHRGWSPGCSGPSVKTQHSPFIAPGPSARARVTFTLAVNHCPCAPHLHIGLGKKNRNRGTGPK